MKFIAATIITAAISLSGILYLLFGGPTGGGAGIEAAASGGVDDVMRRVAAEYRAEKVVTSVLKAPESAKFQKLPTVRHDPARSVYAVTGYVDAENSFGALLRNEYIVMMQQTCDDNDKDALYREGCWEVYGLSIGDKVYIHRTLPGAQ